MAELKFKQLGPWRRTFQWLTTLTILLLPFGSWNGRSLLRIDLGDFSLQFFGEVLRIEELYLFLLFCLAFTLGFLLVTLVFGRVWCGWACPQTTLSDVAEWLARRVGLTLKNNHLQGALWQKALAQALYLALALLVGANLVWYFIEPQRFFSELIQGELHYAVWICMITIALTIYLDMALIRRLMCSDFCPYGRFQTVLVDPATLTLHRPKDEESRCIECGACVRCCPMEIDIRRGYQIECINCGRCLDACGKVMKNLKQPGLIHYTFGVEKLAGKALINPRTLLLSMAMTVLLVVLAVAIGQRPLATLKISVSHTASARLLDDGSQATFFSAWVNNRSIQQETFTILARDSETGQAYPLKGQTGDILLASGVNRGIQFALLSPPIKTTKTVEFILADPQGQELDLSRAQITPYQSPAGRR
jgi:cytochrome c oxidase accessory protein FixG